MKAKTRKRIDELESKVRGLETNTTISANRIIVGHRNPHVVTGQEFTVQEFIDLLLDKLNLALVRTPASVELKKTPGKCKNPNKPL